jgi:hypothetical protein
VDLLTYGCDGRALTPSGIREQKGSLLSVVEKEENPPCRPGKGTCNHPIQRIGKCEKKRKTDD